MIVTLTLGSQHVVSICGFVHSDHI